MIDIKRRQCNYDGCTKSPTYNYEGETKRLYCAEHAHQAMICLNKKHMCENCEVYASFNYREFKTGHFCDTHKLNNMINVTIIPCKTHLCDTKANPKYDGYCFFCYVHTFPDAEISRNYKSKEKSVVDFIFESFPDFTWIADKRIQDGCSLKRPDLLLDLGYQVIIIECDEDQHSNYEDSCDNKRTMQLSQDVNHRPIIFIRFNPDKYIKDGITVPSCWSYNKKILYS